MIDGFDLELDGLGMDGLGFDAVGFDGIGFGDFGGLAGFDPTTTALEGMGIPTFLEFDGLDSAGLDLTGFDLDLSMETVGYRSDLDDVILEHDLEVLIDLELVGELGGDVVMEDAVTFGPQAVPGMSPPVAMGPGSFYSPFLPQGGAGAASVGLGGGEVQTIQQTYWHG